MSRSAPATDSQNRCGSRSWPCTATHGARSRQAVGATMRRAFPALHAESEDGDTLLQGVVADQAALHGVLAQAGALGLELLEVRRLPASDPSSDPTGQRRRQACGRLPGDA